MPYKQRVTGFEPCNFHFFILKIYIKKECGIEGHRFEPTESASTSCDIPFFYIQKQNIKGSHSMRLAKSGSFSYAQRVMTCATMVSPS